MLVTLIIFGKCFREGRRRKREAQREAQQWLASQPPEVIISGRKRAAEWGRLLLEEQMEGYYFVVEFGQSKDPEIQELVGRVAEMVDDQSELSEYKDDIEKQILVLESSILSYEKAIKSNLVADP